MRRFLITAAFVIVAFLLQTTLFKTEFLSFGLTSPNLILMLTFIFGFMRGKKDGMLVGFFGGLLIDIFYYNFIGLNALIFLIIGYINGMFHKIFYDEDITLPLVLLLGSDLIYNILFYALKFMLRGRFELIYYFVHVMLPEMIYTLIITIIVYRFILRLNRRLEIYERRRKSKFV